ncbi:MAG TPA: LytTR family DNA-binding domain-containing protein [Flavitalea sp.]|nr:LytTR family DNA-binding domain-containing protein [Flavitalea sp.]
MNVVNCMIVDDEPIARDIIRAYCNHLPALNVVASCENAFDARLELQRQKIDIIFLDINMPVLDGIAFLKTLKVQPQVIFTTAYKEYALDAFDLSACDYLLKPFSLERFMLAIDKAMDALNAISQPKAETESQQFIFIKADARIYKVEFNDLLFAEAQGNYTRIVMTNAAILPVMTFSGFAEMLPPNQFLRVHRSFIINKSKITHIEGNRVYIGKFEIPIGSNYKDDFFRLLGV